MKEGCELTKVWNHWFASKENSRYMLQGSGFLSELQGRAGDPWVRLHWLYKREEINCCLDLGPPGTKERPEPDQRWWRRAKNKAQAASLISTFVLNIHRMCAPVRHTSMPWTLCICVDILLHLYSQYTCNYICINIHTQVFYPSENLQVKRGFWGPSRSKSFITRSATHAGDNSVYC